MACATGCSSGCSRLGVTDWLADMRQPGPPDAEAVYEVRFKTTRKAFFRNPGQLDLCTGDAVVVECDRGTDVGMLTLGGELAQLNFRKRKGNLQEVRSILRVATPEDEARLAQARSREPETLVRSRAIVGSLGLDMKLSEVEFQADGSKAIFYYTADDRVDFRQLIKLLAAEFRIRVEMRQIGLRQEAAIVGGVGSCGRELCCSSWLTDFKSVNTSAARYQNLSLNPSKITGLCGRLKCCLNFELDTYLQALQDIPRVRELQTELGTAHLQKTDIFRRILWFSYGGDENWYPLTTAQVEAVHRQNQQGIRPPSLAALEDATARAPRSSAPDFVDVVGQSRLHERDANRSGGSRRKKPTIVGKRPPRPSG